jgi:hypothetical protein
MTFFHRRFFLLPLMLLLPLVGPAQESPRPKHVGRVLDWSYRHIVVSGGLSAENLAAAKTEPRILFHLAERNLRQSAGASGQAGENDLASGFADSTVVKRRKPPLKRDWSVSLAAGTVAANMFPAKYTFDINATPDCTNDFVVFGLNVAGVTGGQANLVGLNQLYSGTGGLCGAGNAHVNWAYNGTTVAGGKVLTSPVISLDGKKIAYVESAAGSAIFHVLTWKAGEGTSATNAVVPTPNGSCAGTVVNPTSSCLKSVTLSGTATATLASPWVDYATDTGFAGTDDGNIYKISCVFKCALNTQPAVSWTFTLPVAGTGGAPATPNGPVYDFPSGHLFVGDQLGELWVINAKSNSTPTLAAGPVMIGGGGCTVAHPPGRTGTVAPGTDCNASGKSFGIPDSIIFDSAGAGQRIYAFSGNDGTVGASAVVAQLRADLTGLVRVHIGLGSVANNTTNVDIHSGAFDDNYFEATPTSGHLFVCGTVAGSTAAAFYWIGFTSYPTMNSATTGTIARGPTAGAPCTPITEIFNPNINFNVNPPPAPAHHDIVISGVVGGGADGVLRTDDISTGVITGTLSGQSYPGGISGIIFDDVSASGQASSVYFSTLQTTVNTGGCNGNIHCAVKLTQDGLL